MDQQNILTTSSNELSYLTNERPPPYSVTKNPRPESLMELKTLIEDVVRTDFLIHRCFMRQISWQ